MRANDGKYAFGLPMLCLANEDSAVNVADFTVTRADNTSPPCFHLSMFKKKKMTALKGISSLQCGRIHDTGRSDYLTVKLK